MIFWFPNGSSITFDGQHVEYESLGEYMSFDDPRMAETAVGMLQAKQSRMSLRGMIDAAIKEHEEQVTRLNRIKELLDKNPEIEEFQDLLRNSGLGMRY